MISRTHVKDTKYYLGPFLIFRKEVAVSEEYEGIDVNHEECKQELIEVNEKRRFGRKITIFTTLLITILSLSLFIFKIIWGFP